MMGKVNNSSGIEIIPLDDTNSENNQENTTVSRQESDPLLSQGAKMLRLPYLGDSSILPRVQKYLESNVDKTYVDINVMANDLQSQYREYAKRRRSAFRASVKKAYSIVLKSYGIQGREPSSSEEVSDDSIVDDDGEFPDNSLNNQLMDLYGRPPPKQSSNKVEENELIDISSDESEEETPYLNNKATNGPSTSRRNENSQSPTPFFPEQFDKQQNYGNDKLAYKLPPNTVFTADRGKKRKLDSNNYASVISVTKKKKSLAAFQEPTITFKDIGGMDRVLEDVCKLLVHVKHPEIYRQIGITPPRGFLLHGPPGCGKTLLASAIAGELGVPLLKVAAPELVAGVSGESEERIRELFERATSTSPCILFIDEIDAITPNRQNAQKEMERRIVAQILTCLDDLGQNEASDRVLVIGATNRPDSIDPALRRAGRFDREVCLGIPDIKSREQILKVLTSKLKLAENFDFMSLAKFTPGFVGADLMALIREAAMVAVNRVFNELKEKRKLEEKESAEKLPSPEPVQEPTQPDNKEDKPEPDIVVDDDPKIDVETTPAADPVVVIDDEVKQNETPAGIIEETVLDVTEEFEEKSSLLTPLEELITWLHETSPLTNEQLSGLNITMEDFAKALKCVQPSAKREGFATVPDTTWDDVGSLREIREELQMAILAPVRHAEQFSALGMTASTGVLLCGPPGCGKTLLAKAVANEAGINFISVKGPELLNMYVGESERAVRMCFTRARNSAPCVIFFDEIDALCPKRSDSREGGAAMRVVNQMLTEMDGIEGRQGVFLLAASNRPDIVDPAILRPGRLDKILYVGLPTPVDRVDILRAITKNGTKPPLASDVDLETIGKAEKCDGYSGADLAALVREASIVALKEFMICGNPQQLLIVTTEHFKTAVSKIRPSVSEKDQKYYEKLRKIYASSLEMNEVEEMEYS